VKRRLLFALALVFVFRSGAFAYRPFVSTDAAVADVHEIEIELGYFNLERERGRNNFIVPTVVLNYGFLPRIEAVAEFAVREDARDRARVGDAALSLKAVLREGVMQEKEGPSFALEAGPLLPGGAADERRAGFKGLAILSGRLAPLTWHVNLGGGVNRQRRGFVDWGVIGELPVHPRLRLVAEINGETLSHRAGESSGLLGAIWKAPLGNLFLDAGVRRGIGGTAPPWSFTAGLTVGFSFTAEQKQIDGINGARPVSNVSLLNGTSSSSGHLLD